MPQLIGSFYFIFGLAVQRPKILAGCIQLPIGMNREIMLRLPWAAHAAFFNLSRFSNRSRVDKSPMSEAKEKCKANPGVEPARRAAWVADSGKVYKIKQIKRPPAVFASFVSRQIELARFTEYFEKVLANEVKEGPR
jgi:hypothetical protein